MENLMEFPPHSSNSCTHDINLQGKELAMENFQNLIFKLAQTHPNKPLLPPTKALLQCRFNQFISDYKTPDHPPYSSMIEVALEELNEKAGSSVESISQHIEERHNNLPSAHPMLLKHHLEKLVETEEIVVTRDKRYGLPGRLKLPKRKQRRRKWRYDSERSSHNRRKQRLTRNSKKCEEDEFKYNQNKQQESSEDNSNQTKLETELSALNLINVDSSPSSESTELEVASAETLNGSSNQALRQTSSPVTVNNEEVVDGLQPKCRRLRVVFKLKPADTTDVLQHCDSKQEQMAQPTKRRPGRPRK